MKYVIVRCEDGAQGGRGMATLLGGAKVSHLQPLAQAGAAGVIKTPAAPSVPTTSWWSVTPRWRRTAYGRCRPMRR